MTAPGQDRKAGGPPRYSRQAHPVLRPFVPEYWAMTPDLGAMGGFTITPDRHGELLCCPDELFAVVHGQRQRLPFCTLLGLLDGPLRLESPGTIRVLAARLEPWALGPLRARRSLAGSSLAPWGDASDLLHPHLGWMRGLLTEARWEAGAEVLEQALLDEVGRWDLGGSFRGLVSPFLAETRLPTGRMAEARGLTRRQVERKVRALTGTSPQQLAALARFQRARDAIWADPSVELARLAVAAGYADQSHLTRSFRRYAGLTPRQFAIESKVRKAWLQAQQVAFVQDPPPPPT